MYMIVSNNGYIYTYPISIIGKLMDRRSNPFIGSLPKFYIGTDLHSRPKDLDLYQVIASLIIQLKAHCYLLSKPRTKE